MDKSYGKQDKKPDAILLLLVLFLTIFGLVILYSASSYNGRVRFHDSAYYFKKQLFATALGLMAMYLVSTIDYHIFVEGAPFLYIMSLILSTAVLLAGQEINGSKRWLNLGPFSFQPSEFAKAAGGTFFWHGRSAAAKKRLLDPVYVQDNGNATSDSRTGGF